eukprot:TRINITY_DN2023_c0_g2_i2.p1 TRINITY_DN2023_c0_g2~~TRINITY_DN2023_c0_g2_i2.p1  ORF type:complete len:479 (-),score=71.01 TRINITY_DN2023_c0_g2_i2:209-1645(-)
MDDDEYEELIQQQGPDTSYVEVEDIEDLLKGNMDYGFSLEWLKEATEEEAREFLLHHAGLGRKSVACVMLLALGMKDFPVDVNVGRICTRIGWVPLQVEQEVDEVDMFAPEPQVHRYLYHRLMEFDWNTLYRLHYLMITMGKTICTRQNPNCPACPMYRDCEYGQYSYTKNGYQQPDKQASQNHSKPPLPIPLLFPPHPSMQSESIQTQKTQQSKEVQEVVFYSEQVDQVITLVEEYQHLDQQDKEKYRWKHAISLMGLEDEKLSLTKKEIRKRYIQLAKDVHPDKCLDMRAKEAFSAVGWAYQYLKGTIMPPPSQVLHLPESPFTYPRGLKVFRGFKVKINQIQEWSHPQFDGDQLVVLIEQCVLKVGHRANSEYCVFIPWSICMKGKFPLDGTYFQPNELFLDEGSLRMPVAEENLLVSLSETDSVNVCFGVTINSICRGMTSRVLSNLFQNDFICIRSFNLTSQLPSWLPVQLIK